MAHFAVQGQGHKPRNPVQLLQLDKNQKKQVLLSSFYKEHSLPAHFKTSDLRLDGNLHDDWLL